MENIKIAIIDDKQSDVDLLYSLLTDYFKGKDEINSTIKHFSRGINFIDPFEDIYDLIFLDINMPLMSGLEIAAKIRELGSTALIVFVTNHASLAIDGYGVDALGFVVKPVRKEDVELILDKAFAKLDNQADESKIVLKVKSGYQTIKVSTIKYIEVAVHDIFFYTTNGIFRTRGTLKKIEELFTCKNIVKCSSCHLVNLDFIESVVKDEIKIDGKKIKIARNRKKQFLEEFLSYYQ